MLGDTQEFHSAWVMFAESLSHNSVTYSSLGGAGHNRSVPSSEDDTRLCLISVLADGADFAESASACAIALAVHIMSQW